DDQHQTRYTTSEGQAYALFFSLVANERGRFDTLLRWTERHLAAGDLTARLPGWRWGRHDSGEWTLVDANPASDADLWLASTLLEAARLWNMPSYGLLGHALLARIEASELVRLPGLGWMLLPAPEGFQTDTARWRFNPSYLPIHQLRYFAALRGGSPWTEIIANTLAMLRAVAPHGFVPDWVE
ncbi:glycosyl hydrolase family 8, partial [Enterococcus faecalis]|uniref:glycosyl hydrolase family 8 n=1 Tax=Enterococcus faecalis TaxID=1351 RepID=UPI0034E3989C